MAYMVLRHTNPALYHSDKWYVADMDHPEHHGVIVKKTLREALDFCARLNRGERFANSAGTETREEGMRRTYQSAVDMVDRLGLKAVDWPVGDLLKEAVEMFAGVEWSKWVNTQANRSRQALDLG